MPSILLVEDHEVMAETMAEYLRWKLDAEVQIVQSADAARHEVEEHTPDLALIDVSLPDVNGIDLVAELRERAPDMPCLVVSGHVELKYVRRAFDAGVQGYIEKGDPDALVDAVQRVLAGGIYVSEHLSDQIAE